MGICFIDGCSKSSAGRTLDKRRLLCKAHWSRQYRHGDPLGGRPSPEGRKCDVVDCDRRHYCRGYCGLHYSRYQRHGDPLKVVNRDPRVPWTSYHIAHARLISHRGPASNYACVDCAGPARDWSYAGGAPDEQREPSGKRRAFSEDHSYYQPRCRTCHWAYDRGQPVK